MSKLSSGLEVRRYFSMWDHSFPPADAKTVEERLKDINTLSYFSLDLLITFNISIFEGKKSIQCFEQQCIISEVLCSFYKLQVFLLQQPAK